MFPKSNIIHDPFSYISQELLNTHDHHHHQNPNSTSKVVEEEDHPFFLNNFPSPFLDDHELPLSQIFSQKHHQELEASENHDITKADPDNAIKDNHSIGNSRSTLLNTKIMGDQSSNLAITGKIPSEPATSSKKRKLSAKPRRRTGKKDRHSKICTAQGVRDRRMRLSLQIARKFFDLQDMLGFDKASNTIEWLFTKSKNAIKELSKNTPQENNSSENNDDNRKLRKIGSNEKPIRAMAREKTKEKMMIKLGHNKKGNQELDETNPKLGSNSKSLEHQFANVGIMEKYLGGASYSSITSIFDYDNNGIIKGDIDVSDNCFNLGIHENFSMTNEVQIPFAGI